MPQTSQAHFFSETVGLAALQRDLDRCPGTPFDLDDLVGGAIHLWRITIDSLPCESEAFRQLLTDDERARAARITRRNGAQLRFVAARGMLRILLGRYLRISAAAVAFELGPFGKPRLAGLEPDRGLVFNNSHSGNQLAIGFACDGRLGVDIECWRPVAAPAHLIARCSAEPERRYWNGLPEERKQEQLFRLWTLKEAYCKAVGRGLALGLDRCVFDCEGEVPRLIACPPDVGDRDDWHFVELGGSPGISGAVAFNRAIRCVRTYDLPQQPVGF